jgi:DNA-3-methyladenine glycosylase
MSSTRLERAFFLRSTAEVARDLLGRALCRRLDDGTVLRGRVVEVEAYDGPGDRASHAYRGRTARNEPMFEAGGIAYVYLVYGVHNCLNVVTGPAGHPAAVLLRAAESPPGSPSASGPGRLTRAFRVTREQDRESFLGPVLWFESGEPVADRMVRRTARIGVGYAGSWARRKLRFLIRDHPAVS